MSLSPVKNPEEFKTSVIHLSPSRGPLNIFLRKHSSVLRKCSCRISNLLLAFLHCRFSNFVPLCPIEMWVWKHSIIFRSFPRFLYRIVLWWHYGWLLQDCHNQSHYETELGWWTTEAFCHGNEVNTMMLRIARSEAINRPVRSQEGGVVRSGRHALLF